MHMTRLIRSSPSPTPTRYDTTHSESSLFSTQIGHPRSRDLLLGEVLRLVGGVDGVGSLLPAGGAHLAVLVRELERLHHTNGLLDGTANGEVVDVRGAEGAGRVDEEGAAKSNAFVLEQDAVRLGDGVRAVGELYISNQSC